MKYKVGDIVKITDSQHGHRFNIGEIVRISEVLDRCYRAKYLDGHDWWAVGEDEIELYEEKKMPKYTTEPIDYTGCHPVIAEHLKRGEAILCRVWGYGTKEEWQDQKPERVIAFKGGRYPYTTLDSAGSWRNAEPIPVKRKVLMSAEKAVVKLIENGWKVSEDGKRLKGSSQEVSTLYLKRNEGLETTAFLPNYLFEEVDD